MAYTFTNGALYSNGKPVMVNQAGFLQRLPSDAASLGLLGLPGEALSLAQGNNPISGAIHTVQDTASASVSGVKAVLAAGQWLSNRNNWIRVAKVVVGAAMIIEGLALLVAKPLTPQLIAAASKAVK
jgi:hypothetical protein